MSDILSYLEFVGSALSKNIPHFNDWCLKSNGVIDVVLKDISSKNLEDMIKERFTCLYIKLDDFSKPKYFHVGFKLSEVAVVNP